MNAPVKPKSQRSASRNLPECRAAYPYLHEKRTKNAGGLPFKTGPRYDGTLMLPKLADAASCPNYKILSDMCMEAAGKMWPGHGWPQGAIWPVKDGDVPYTSKPKPGVAPKTPEQIAASNAWRKGYWIIEATSHLDPGPRVAVMQNGVMTEIPARVVNGVTMYKSGDYCIPHVSAYAYQNEQFGVNFSIEGVLFTRPGEAIGSSGPKSAAQMFGDVAGMAPGPGPIAGPPATYAAPTMPSPSVAPAAPPSAAMPPPPAPGVAASLPPFPAPR